MTVAPRGLAPILLAALSTLCAAAPARAAGGVVFPGASWETRTPAEVGLDPTQLAAFRALAGPGPGVVTRFGYLVDSWGDPTAHGEWASASKSILSTLLFFAVEEGRLGSVDERVEDLGWALTPADSTMTLRQLANMTGGYALSEAPGARWAYNDYAVKLYALSLLDRVFAIDPASASEMEALVAAPARLGPLQFEDGALFTIRNGMPRVNMTPRDFARVGWWWAHRGRWDGQQLLPASSFDLYLRPGVPSSMPRTSGIETPDYLGIGSAGGGRDQTPLGPGRFGFMWWFNPGRSTWPSAPADTFQANGHWNQEVLTVIPSLGLVAAWRGGAGANPATFDQEMDAVLAPLVGAATLFVDGFESGDTGAWSATQP